MLGLVSLSLGAAAVRAEEDDTPLRAGVWALQFSVAEDFTLSSFDGAAVSIKRHFSPQSALRVGLELDLDDSSTEETRTDTDAESLLAQSESDSNGEAVVVNAAYMRYAQTGRVVRFVWQLGPELSVGRTDGRNSSGPLTSETTHKRWSVGLAGSVGVEWFPTRRFGLHAEYGMAAYYWSRTTIKQTEWVYPNQSSDRYRDESDMHGTALVSRAVRLGLSVYF
jgi:opacity protein-like surface antigen